LSCPTSEYSREEEGDPTRFSLEKKSNEYDLKASFMRSNEYDLKAGFMGSNEYDVE
jgi:hypothetical protein